jgi:ubiquitin-conjugating enzyme E2 variant
VLPKHDEFSLFRRAFSVTAITAATTLLAWNLYVVITAAVSLEWVVPVAVAGVVAADFLSGIVHWTADTWGSESMPLIGRRFLHPFRVHHVNPDDFLRRRFIDTNGDVALLVIPVLTITLALPRDSQWGVPAALFLGAFAGVGLLTNQVHQWAHMPRPPALVRALQHCGLILGREAHARHHRPPYDANYCIATGWCNRPLAAIHFFRRLERTITWLTGLHPRQDDAAFHAKSGADRFALLHCTEKSDGA